MYLLKFDFVYIITCHFRITMFYVFIIIKLFYHFTLIVCYITPFAKTQLIF
jgi:hypothetical protein